MTRQRIAYLSALAASAVLFLGLLAAGACANERHWAEPALNRFLADVLRGDVASDDDGILYADIGLAAVDARGIPNHASISRDPKDGRLEVSRYSHDDIPIPPGDMMQTATYAWLLDHKRITLHERIAAGADSVTVREAFLRPACEVSLPPFDREPYFWDSYPFVSDLVRYFGPSRAFYLPRYYYHSLLEDEFRSITDGSGILLSQDQLLSFYGSIAREGARPERTWHHRRRICSKETASALTSLLRENILAGKDTLLARLAVPVAGRGGDGILDKGWIPFMQVRPSDSVRVSSFVGFFPSHAPKYTLCVSVYSSDTTRTETAVRIFEDIVNHLDKEGRL